MKVSALILILPLLSLLTQCSPSSGGSNKGPLPVLTSPGRAKAWGTPQTVQTKNGYQTTYINPSNRRERIRILASRDMMFFLLYPPNIKGTTVVNGVKTVIDEPQSWKKTFVNGKEIRWYQTTPPTAVRAAIFKTLGAELKDGAGNAGNFRIEAEGTKNQMQTWLSELRFDQ